MKKEVISIEVLNEVLGKNKHKYLQQEKQGHIGVPSDGEGNQGEYNETFKFYKHPDFPEGIFLRETYNTDSYGYNDNLVEVLFVKGKEKKVTVYEPI